MSVIGNESLGMQMGIISLVILTIVSLLVVLLLMRGRQRSLPYISQPSLDTPTEQAFHAALQRAISFRAMIACKVRLADVFRFVFGGVIHAISSGGNRFE